MAVLVLLSIMCAHSMGLSLVRVLTSGQLFIKAITSILSRNDRVPLLVQIELVSALRSCSYSKRKEVHCDVAFVFPVDCNALYKKGGLGLDLHIHLV